jgi:hypothetical protein
MPIEGKPMRMRELPPDRRAKVRDVRTALVQGLYPEKEIIAGRDVPNTMLSDLGIAPDN